MVRWCPSGEDSYCNVGWVTSWTPFCPHLSPGPLLFLSLSPLSCKAPVPVTRPLPSHIPPGTPKPSLQFLEAIHSSWYFWGLSFSPPPPLPLPSSMKTGTLGSLTATSCLGRTVWSWCGMTRDSGVMCLATTTSPTPARWGLVRAGKGKGGWICRLQKERGQSYPEEPVRGYPRLREGDTLHWPAQKPLIFLVSHGHSFPPHQVSGSHHPQARLPLLTVRLLQCPVGLRHSCPWLKYLVVLGCATRWTPYYDIGAERGWPSATCL